MQKLKKQILKRPAHVMAFVSALVLAAAYMFQFFGFAPCDLCWYQRYPYMAIVGIMFCAFALRQTHSRVVLFLFSCLALLDALVAGYHTGVEQHWWQGPTTCTSGAFDVSTIELNADTLYTLDTAIVRCDEIAWSLGGVSMAGYNMLIALGLGIFGFYALLSKRDAQ